MTVLKFTVAISLLAWAGSTLAQQADACTDFDVFVNGRWHATAELPAHRSRIGSFDTVGSSRVDLQACKLEYSIVSPK